MPIHRHPEFGERLLFRDVLEATQAVIGIKRQAETWEIQRDVAVRLGYKEPMKISSRFLGQVNRALAQLTREAKLVRVSRGESLPHGSYSNYTTYFTPQAYAAAQDEHDASRKAQEFAEGKWQEIHDRLIATGITPVSLRGQPVQLDRASWYYLLGMKQS
jgi:hypothetical protein